MGTATFEVSRYGERSRNLTGRLITSGAHTTSTSASNMTDGAAGAGSAINVVRGNVLAVMVDEDARLKFGGETATATDGHLLQANVMRFLEISGNGTVSIIDVA